MNKVKSVKVWSKNWNGQGGFRKEFRIYINTADGRRGGLFLTGNPYQERGHIDGQITSEDIEAAREVAVWGGKWHTVYGD